MNGFLLSGLSKNSLDPLFGAFSVDSCFRRNDRGSVRFFVEISFSSRFEAGPSTLSFLRKGISKKSATSRFSDFFMDPCFRRNDIESVCLSVEAAFSESPDAGLPTLSSLRKQESIL
ncbi:MAG: hypothetical protein AAF471_06885, partial [Myxococcota bacterium]